MYETNEFIDDIIDALKDVYKNDLNMYLYCLQGLYLESDNNTYKEEIDKVCNENELCHNCFEPLEINSYKGDKYDYGDESFTEDLYERSCPNCGKVNL